VAVAEAGATPAAAEPAVAATATLPAERPAASGNGTKPAPASTRQTPARIVTDESDLTARARRREQQRRQREEMAKQHAVQAAGLGGYTEEPRRELSNG
jgi:50S ribosomal subunit-associated GTPase HflX